MKGAVQRPAATSALARGLVREPQTRRVAGSGARWGRLASGMAWSQPALLLSPLMLLVLTRPVQLSPDYHYFGEKGEGDTWELLRQQHQKGNRRRRV